MHSRLQGTKTGSRGRRLRGHGTVIDVGGTGGTPRLHYPDPWAGVGALVIPMSIVHTPKYRTFCLPLAPNHHRAPRTRSPSPAADAASAAALGVGRSKWPGGLSGWWAQRCDGSSCPTERRAGDGDPLPLPPAPFPPPFPPFTPDTAASAAASASSDRANEAVGVIG